MTLTTAVCFAAGLGARMRPLTNDRPKALIKLGGRTLLARHVEGLIRSGFRRILINAHYYGEQVVYHVAELRRRFPHVNIVCVPEDSERPLETGGGIVNLLPLIEGEAFAAVNVDALFLGNAYLQEMRRLVALYKSVRDHALLLQPINRQTGYGGSGDFYFTDNARIRLKDADADKLYVFTGMQILRRDYFVGKPRAAWSLKKLYQDDTQHKYGAVSGSYPWLHVGDPPGLLRANRYVAGKQFTHC